MTISNLVKNLPKGKGKFIRFFPVLLLTKGSDFYIVIGHLVSTRRFGRDRLCSIGAAELVQASVAQSAERNHGKVEVSGSIPLGG